MLRRDRRRKRLHVLVSKPNTSTNGNKMPVQYPSEAGKPYRPSNGTEGGIFMSQFCDRCGKCEDGFCEIISDTMLLDTDDPNYPKEWKFDAEGCPTCTAFEST